MKSILVIGMGRFGYHLARKLTELGNEVMVVDSDADRINEVAPFFADAQIADCTRAAALRSFGLDGFDICYVAIGDDLATCLEITYQLKALGAKRIVAKIEELLPLVDWKLYRTVSRTRPRHRLQYAAMRISPRLFRAIVKTA